MVLSNPSRNIITIYNRYAIGSSTFSFSFSSAIMVSGASFVDCRIWIFFVGSLTASNAAVFLQNHPNTNWCNVVCGSFAIRILEEPRIRNGHADIPGISANEYICRELRAEQSLQRKGNEQTQVAAGGNTHGRTNHDSG